MRTDFMASAKQIAWRKKFARMSKAGKFKKSQTPERRKQQSYQASGQSIAPELQREIMAFMNKEARIGGDKASTMSALKNIVHDAWIASGLRG